MKKKFIKIKNFYCLIFIIMFISLLNVIKTEEEPDDSDYIVYFDISDPDISIKDNEELNNIVSKSASNFIPRVKLNKEGYYFSGWTEDGIYGFEPGDVFISQSKNVTLKPVFALISDKNKFALEYIVEFEGEIIDSSEYLYTEYYSKNRIVATSLMSFPQLKATQRGWTDGTNSFVQGQKIIIPEHNVTLYALFFYYRNLTYVSGDVDGIVGLKYDIQTMRAGGVKDLAEETRISRKGYKMIAWHCENDGIDYPFFYQYVMPDENVIMTAIWEPLTYTVVFNTGVNTISNIKIQGKTNEIIIAPFLEKEREGYTFLGWKIYESYIYYPGDEIIVEGQMPGIGISAKAIWISN